MAEATALLLAGGRSRRMGRDKRFLPVGGETLLKRTFEVARQTGLEVRVLIARADEEDKLLESLAPTHQEPVISPTVVIDSQPGAGPLAAVADAAAQVPTPWVLVLAVDYPALNSGFLRGLLERAERLEEEDMALVPEAQSQAQYACALYRRASLMEIGETRQPPSSFRSWLGSREGVVLWRESEWRKLASADTLVNWNRPGDWRP